MLVQHFHLHPCAAMFLTVPMAQVRMHGRLQHNQKKLVGNIDLARAIMNGRGDP
jgi:hypothetical protein